MWEQAAQLAAAILTFLEQSHKKLEACGAQDSQTLPPGNVTRRELASTNSFTNPAVVVNRKPWGKKKLDLEVAAFEPAQRESLSPECRPVPSSSCARKTVKEYNSQSTMDITMKY